jgi:hypothetical protein
MQAMTDIANTSGASSANPTAGPAARDTMKMEPLDGSEFRAIMERHIAQDAPVAPAAHGQSVGQRFIDRASTLSNDIQQDQKYISHELEQATRAGDSMQLMKAMLALNDYQTRVQFVAKMTSKAISSVEQLTKLQ